MTMTDKELVRLLAAEYLDLRALLDEHMAEHRGEVLPHVFMGDVTRWVVSIAADSQRHNELRRILQLLENEFERGDEPVRELISVSFLENLPLGGKPRSDIVQALGPNLAGELNRMG